MSVTLSLSYQHKHSSQNNFKRPETLSTILTGPGPIPSTVLEPGAIWVRPASHTRLVISPRLWAVVASSSSSSSVSTFSTTLACPPSSHCLRMAGRWRRARWYAITAAWEHCNQPISIQLPKRVADNIPDLVNTYKISKALLYFGKELSYLLCFPHWNPEHCTLS